MPQDIIVNVTRGHPATQGPQNEPVRIVEKTIFVQGGAGGAVPYNFLELYSLRGVPDIRQGDVLTDTVSGQQYRTSGTVFKYDQSFLKVEITRYTAGTP